MAKNFIEPNPILVKELRSRMRGNRAFLMLTGMLIILAGFSYALYRLMIASVDSLPLPISPQIGQILFAGLAILELLLICAMAPAVTAGAISSEKEKQTYEMLLATPLPPARVLWGKLISALGYIFLLIFAVIPMVSLVFIYGGVSIREMFKAFILLIVVAVMFGVIGLFLSALFGRTDRSTTITYLIVAGILFGPLFISLFLLIINQGKVPNLLLSLSPISAMLSAITPSFRIDSFGGIMWRIGNFDWLAGSKISYDSIPRPLYHYSVPIYAGITLLLYIITTRLVLPTRRWRIRFAEAVVGLVLVLGFTVFVALGYLGTANRYERILIVEESNTPPEEMVTPFTPTPLEQGTEQPTPPLKGP